MAAATGSAIHGWVMACVLAEAIGMTAAATAARIADQAQAQGHGPETALAVVVCGGLVEGAALGLLQGRVLGPVLGSTAARRWALGTFVVAGVGWAAASTPAVFASHDPSDPSPPLLLVLVAAAGLGIAMGAVLGTVQALALRSRVLRPWRWVPISAAGWTPAMVVIFVGATLPTAATPTAAVIPIGTLTGVLAGTVLGIITGSLLHTLGGTAEATRSSGSAEDRRAHAAW